MDLKYEQSGRWQNLPEWAHGFIGVGKELAAAQASAHRLVVVIVVPTRAYCAAFVCLGLIASDAVARGASSVAAHFEQLFDLPPGTPVILRLNTRKVLKGVLQAPEEIRGKLHLRVQVESLDPRYGGGLTYLIDELHALQVQPANHSGHLPRKQRADNNRLSTRFIDTLLTNSDHSQPDLQSRLVCAIVGNKGALENELRQTPLAVHAGAGEPAEGCLQDVLRIDRFVAQKQVYRSALIPIGASPPSEETVCKVEKAVIFDGAAGYLKWAELWPGKHQAVILDRTELHFDEAISAINTRYSQHRAHTAQQLPALNAPASVELLAFWEGTP